MDPKNSVPRLYWSGEKGVFMCCLNQKSRAVVQQLLYFPCRCIEMLAQAQESPPPLPPEKAETASRTRLLVTASRFATLRATVTAPDTPWYRLIFQLVGMCHEQDDMLQLRKLRFAFKRSGVDKSIHIA